jgi:hypothetical protein
MHELKPALKVDETHLVAGKMSESKLGRQE